MSHPHTTEITVGVEMKITENVNEMLSNYCNINVTQALDNNVNLAVK